MKCKFTHFQELFYGITLKLFLFRWKLFYWSGQLQSGGKTRDPWFMFTNQSPVWLPSSTILASHWSKWVWDLELLPDFLSKHWNGHRHVGPLLECSRHWNGSCDGCRPGWMCSDQLSGHHHWYKPTQQHCSRPWTWKLNPIMKVWLHLWCVCDCNISCFRTKQVETKCACVTLRLWNCKVPTTARLMQH